MLLQNILLAKEEAPCVLIEDDLQYGGRACFKAFLGALAQRCSTVVLILTEVEPESFCRGLPADLLNKLKIIDVASNPNNWLTRASPDTTSYHQVSIETAEFYPEVTSMSGCTSGEEIGVAIDSLDEILLHRSLSYTCQTLHKLSQHDRTSSKGCKVQQVVSLVHSDLHNDSALDALRHISSTSIRMSRPKDTVNYHFASNILHKRASGKVLRSEEQYNMTNEFTLDDISEVLHLKNPQTSESGPDPAANLTFNLSLSNQEREARSQLVLPYTRKNNKEEVRPSSAKIFYQPDEADDFDEEDPDDDLDI